MRFSLKQYYHGVSIFTMPLTNISSLRGRSTWLKPCLNITSSTPRRVIPKHMSSPNVPAKRKHDMVSQNSRKSLRADVFCRWPGAGRKATGTQATDGATHLSRDSDKDLQHEASSEDEIQMTGWRHASVPRSITPKCLPAPSTSKARQEIILISSDDDADGMHLFIIVFVVDLTLTHA